MKSKLTLEYKRKSGRNFLLSPGSRPATTLEVTPTNLRMNKPPAAASVSSPHTTQQPHRLNSPSRAILNFTLQNLGLISSPGNTFAPSQTPERSGAQPSPLALQQRGMVFIKPVSPVPVQQSLPGQPLTLISVQQVNVNG